VVPSDARTEAQDSSAGMYDGDHSSADQFRGIFELQEFFRVAEDVVLLVDDFQGEAVRRATRRALDVLTRDYGWALLSENAAHTTKVEREANGVFVLSRRRKGGT
jgi:hypothetical protein